MVTKAQTIEAAVDEMMARRDTGSPMDGVVYPYKDNIRLHNHIRFFHPDGTHSDIAGPTYNPLKPTPYLERFLFHWTKKRGPTGGRWFFLTPQASPPEQPIRCFVPNCPRAGGFTSNTHLYQHVMAKHGEESRMYADVLEEMKRQTQAALDPTVLESLRMRPRPPTKGDAPEPQGPDLFHCTAEGCKRFFDTKQGKKLHEKKGHK